MTGRIFSLSTTGASLDEPNMIFSAHVSILLSFPQISRVKIPIGYGHMSTSLNIHELLRKERGKKTTAWLRSA